MDEEYKTGIPPQTERVKLDPIVVDSIVTILLQAVFSFLAAQGREAEEAKEHIRMTVEKFKAMPDLPMDID